MNSVTDIQKPFFSHSTQKKQTLRLWRYLRPFCDVPVVSREEGNRYLHTRSVCFEYCVNGKSPFEYWWCYWLLWL